MKFKKYTLILAIITFILLNNVIIYATNTNKSNIQNYFRIHVVANSDSIDDQLIKYTVAKDVNSFLESLTSTCKSKEECKSIIEENIYNILDICDNTLKSYGCPNTVKAQIGNILYTDKSKDNTYMNGGIYDSLKIIIGDGNGQNWWSLIYPTYSKTDDYNDEKKQNIEVKFGIIDLIKKLFEE